MNEYIFDLEGDGLNPTKIHVLSVGTLDGKIFSTDNYDKMRKFFLNEENTIIAHNCIRFDIPVVERLLDIEVKCKVVDTIHLSWYIEFERGKHGLESWGETFGIEKPEIKDWHNLSYADYELRCRRDVQINTELWKHLKKKLHKLYDGDYQRLIDYLNFKMKCARMQEEARWKLDVDRCKKGINDLSFEEQVKVTKLAEVMPKVPKKVFRKRPKKPYKNDGTLSSLGVKWFILLDEKGLPEDTKEVEVISGYDDPNPGSHQQIKDWLYSLGWKPETFKYDRNKETNEVRQIPQINLPHGKGVCPSIKKLFKKEPNLELLDGLGVLRHRISILKGFLRDMDSEGYVQAKVAGITNTMRFKHAVCVNLPGVDKPYGELIRGCLIAEEGTELCGSDMMSLEQRTKEHYLWRFDKPYVKKMMEPGYCAHVDIAVQAGWLTEEEEERHKTGDFINEEDKAKIKAERKKAKPVNYGATYNQQPKGLARETGMPLKQAKELYEVYWRRNWAIKAVAKSTKTKAEFGTLWLFNPVSKLWYQLRNEGDIFSTLNQGTGAFCFDIWLKYVIMKLKRLTGQFHDEGIWQIKKGYRKECETVLRWAIKEANKELKLNRSLDVDVQFDNTYAGIH